MSEKMFKQTYRDFIVNTVHLSRGSAYSYITYLNNACKLPGMNNHLALLATSQQNTQIKLAEELCDAIDLAYDDPNCVVAIKDLDNSHSAAHVLLAFVSGKQWIKHKGFQVSFTHIFSKKSLTKTFRSRLRTQDRIYNYGAFPTNLISKLATKYKIRGFWDKMIDDTKIVYTPKGNYYLFKDIDCLMFGNDNNVYFEKDGDIYTVYTKINSTGNYQKLKTNKIRDVSLDHDYPIERALEDTFNSKPIPELRKLGNDILIFKSTYKKTHPKAKNPEIIGEYEKIYDSSRLMIDERALLKEVQDFLDTLSMTIMHNSQNTAKSNQVSP